MAIEGSVSCRCLGGTEQPGAVSPQPDSEGAEGWAVRVAPTAEWPVESRWQLTTVSEGLAEWGG
jgi:hypothetical protein